MELRSPFLSLCLVHGEIDIWEHLKHTSTLSLYTIFSHGRSCTLISQNLSNPSSVPVMREVWRRCVEKVSCQSSNPLSIFLEICIPTLNLMFCLYRKCGSFTLCWNVPSANPSSRARLKHKRVLFSPRCCILLQNSFQTQSSVKGLS